jgi:hypothetical protein
MLKGFCFAAFLVGCFFFHVGWAVEWVKYEVLLFAVYAIFGSYMCFFTYFKYGPIADTMNIVKTHKKEHLNTLGK